MWRFYLIFDAYFSYRCTHQISRHYKLWHLLHISLISLFKTVQFLRKWFKCIIDCMQKKMEMFLVLVCVMCCKWRGNIESWGDLPSFLKLYACTWCSSSLSTWNTSWSIDYLLTQLIQAYNTPKVNKDNVNCRREVILDFKLFLFFM